MASPASELARLELPVARKVRPAAPSEEWLLGAAARDAFRGLHGNPFTRGTSLFYRWREGWEYRHAQLAGGV